MKKLIVFACTSLVSLSIWAQSKPALLDEPTYKFTIEKELPSTPPQNQYQTSTCWVFSTLAFLESELLRMGKGEYNLSEMYVARRNTEKKTDRFVRMHGKARYAPGGLTVNVFELIKEYGILPEEAYKGLCYGESRHKHDELDSVLEAYARTIAKGKKLTTAWRQGLNGILDAYFGEVPETFSYEGKEYTSKSFAESLELNMDDYVLLTSYTHHPFYAPFVLEVPDNYYWGKFYNIPLDELIGVIDNAIETGYTVVWNADMSSKGYNYREGYAVVPENDADLDQIDNKRIHKETVSDKKSSKKTDEPKPNPVKEKTITQEMRQQSFDSYETQDDHLMLIIGTAKDQNAKRFYKVKDSWDIDSTRYRGYVFASVPYMRYKTIAITVHKNAIPVGIAAKLK